MKITTKNTENHVNLWEMDGGEIFRPTNSQRVFMKLWNEINDDIWSDENRLYMYYENPQDHYLDNMRKDGVACVNMENGEIVIFHRDLQVVKLNYTLEVEG